MHVESACMRIESGTYSAEHMVMGARPAKEVNDIVDVAGSKRLRAQGTAGLRVGQGTLRGVRASKRERCIVEGRGEGLWCQSRRSAARRA